MMHNMSGPGGPPPPPPMGLPPPPGLSQSMSQLFPPMPLPLLGMSGGMEALQSGGGVGGIAGPPPGQPMADGLGVAPAAKGPKPLRIPPEGKAQPRACGAPIAKRTLAELKADEKKTGIKVPEDLPPDFPRGPWVVDMTKPPDHVPATGAHDGGWKYQEEQMVVQWKCWCSDPNTPLDAPGLDLNKYNRGGFQLAGTTRSTPTSATGTVKRARCTGRSEGDKGSPRPCSFKIQAEFVAEVLPGKHGWVLRSVDGANHMLAESHGGKPHPLVHSFSTVMESGRLRKGTSRLRQAEYFKTGMRMKLAGNSCAMIHETLRIVAEEEGREALWNLADIKEVFGLDPKKRAANEEKDGVPDKHQRCVNQCREICAKIRDEPEECEMFLLHLNKFEKQLSSRRRKRKAAMALGSHENEGPANEGRVGQIPLGSGAQQQPPQPHSDPSVDLRAAPPQRPNPPEMGVYQVPQPPTPATPGPGV